MSKEVGGMGGSRTVKGPGSARTEGARRATGVRADAAAGAAALGPGQRWSASRKRDVVLRLLRGESLDAVSREVGVEIYRLEEWRDRAWVGMDLGLKDRQGEPLLYYTRLFMVWLLIGVFSFFGLHTLLWLLRSLKEVGERRARRGGH